MTIRRPGYYYDGQIRSYLLHFMAIFGGIQVMTGKRTGQGSQTITVPIIFGQMDAVVAAIMSNNTQTAPTRLPIMSAEIVNLALSNERMHGQGVVRSNTFVPTGGLLPTDMKTIHQRMPVPYTLTLNLNIFASNSDQHLQILEQFLPMFDPLLVIEKSDAIFDWTRQTTVTLTNGPQFAPSPYTPPGADKRIVTSVLQFTMEIWLDTPADVRRDFVESIKIRIGTVHDYSITDEQILADLDGQGIPYETVATDEGLTL